MRPICVPWHDSVNTSRTYPSPCNRPNRLLTDKELGQGGPFLHQGVIRYREVRWSELEKAVDTLLHE